jgi:serine/threonine protein kinase
MRQCNNIVRGHGTVILDGLSTTSKNSTSLHVAVSNEPATKMNHRMYLILKKYECDLDTWLEKKVHDRGYLTRDIGQQMIGLLYDVSLGLQHLHIAGLCHRDVKPENILLFDNSHHAVLCDMGFTRHSGLPTDATGTAEYYSPEMISDGIITSAADMWAFGLVMQRCLQSSDPSRFDETLDLFRSGRAQQYCNTESRAAAYTSCVTGDEPHIFWKMSPEVFAKACRKRGILEAQQPYLWQAYCGCMRGSYRHRWCATDVVNALHAAFRIGSIGNERQLHQQNIIIPRSIKPKLVRLQVTESKTILESTDSFAQQLSQCINWDYPESLTVFQTAVDIGLCMLKKSVNMPLTAPQLVHVAAVQLAVSLCLDDASFAQRLGLIRFLESPSQPNIVSELQRAWITHLF